MDKLLVFEHCKKRIRSNSDSSSDKNNDDDDFDDIIKRFKPDSPKLRPAEIPKIFAAKDEDEDEDGYEEDDEEDDEDEDFKRNTIRFTLKETEALKSDTFAKSTICQVIANNKFICDEVSYQNMYQAICKEFNVKNPVICTTRVQIMRQICKIGRFHHLRINIENEAGESLVIHNM